MPRLEPRKKIFRTIMTLGVIYLISAGLLCFLMATNGGNRGGGLDGFFAGVARGGWRDGRLTFYAQAAFCLTDAFAAAAAILWLVQLTVARIDAIRRISRQPGERKIPKLPRMLPGILAIYIAAVVFLAVIVTLSGRVTGGSIQGISAAFLRGLWHQSSPGSLSGLLFIFSVVMVPLGVAGGISRMRSTRPQYFSGAKAADSAAMAQRQTDFTGVPVPADSGDNDARDSGEPGNAAAEELPASDRFFQWALLLVAAILAAAALASLDGFSAPRSAFAVTSAVLVAAICAIGWICDFHGAMKSGRLSGKRLLSGNPIWLKLLWALALLLAIWMAGRLVYMTVYHPVLIRWGNEFGTLAAIYAWLFCCMAAAINSRRQPLR